MTVYVLFTGGLMLLGGRSADLFGRRRVFLIGLVIFTAASLASGLAWSPHALIVSRAVQGLGAALLLPSALAIIAPTYAGAQRAVALAIWGAIGSAGVAIGVLLGGIQARAAIEGRPVLRRFTLYLHSRQGEGGKAVGTVERGANRNAARRCASCTHGDR